MYSHVIDGKYADEPCLPYLPAVADLEALGTGVKVLPKRNAVAPCLDFPLGSPYLQVDRFACLQHLAKCTNVN